MDMPVDYERIGRFIYAFHRLGAGGGRLRSSSLAASGDAAALELHMRAARLADRFDALIEGGGIASASDAELQAMLDEAAALCAARGGA